MMTLGWQPSATLATPHGRSFAGCSSLAIPLSLFHRRCVGFPTAPIGRRATKLRAPRPHPILS